MNNVIQSGLQHELQILSYLVRNGIIRENRFCHGWGIRNRSRTMPAAGVEGMPSHGNLDTIVPSELYIPACRNLSLVIWQSIASEQCS